MRNMADTIDLAIKKWASENKSVNSDWIKQRAGYIAEAVSTALKENGFDFEKFSADSKTLKEITSAQKQHLLSLDLSTITNIISDRFGEVILITKKEGEDMITTICTDKDRIYLSGLAACALASLSNLSQ